MVRFSPYGIQTAPLVEQVLLKTSVFIYFFQKNLAVIITLEWTTKAYPEEQDKYGLFVFFFHSMRDITLSISFSYTAERQLAFFMNWKFLLILRGKDKYIIHRPGSVQIGKNCARELLCTVFPYLERAWPINLLSNCNVGLNE